MTESILNQYIHFIQDAKSLDSLKHIEDKLIRMYGNVDDKVKVELTKARNRIVNAKIEEDDKIIAAQNEHIKKLKCQKQH